MGSSLFKCQKLINKGTQTSGGTAGFSLNPGAVKRYYITAKYRSSFPHLMRTFIESGGSRDLHPDLLTARMEYDGTGSISSSECH